MTDEPQREIDEELDAFRRLRPGAYELARILSLAARVEHSLVRRARLLLPQVDASAEGDLWASGLTASQTAQGIVFDPAGAIALRRRLAADRDLFDAAWALIAWEHRNAPWPVRAEEMINRLTASGVPEDADRSEQVLLATARQMVDATDRVAAARWVMRTFARLPPSLSASPAARAIQAGVGAQLDGRLEMEGNLPADTMENWLPWLFANAQEHTQVRLSIGDGFLEIDASDPAVAGSDTISIPDTSPLLIDVRWHDGLSPHAVRVAMEPGERRRVAVTSTSVEVRAIDGTRADVRVSGASEHDGGIDFSAIRARHRPFVDREQELKEIDELLAGRGRVVGILGDSGFGKTALLCACLDRLEARGEHVIAHFLDGGPESWKEPAFVEASLASQLAALLPEPPPSGGAQTLADLISSVARGRRLFILIDAVYPSDRNALLETLTRVDIRDTVTLAYTSEQRATGLRAMMREQVAIDLSERSESNHQVCEQYLELHRRQVESRVVGRTRSGRPTAFLAHRFGAGEIANQVERYLRSLDVEVFLVSLPGEIKVGANWEKEIGQGITDADFFVVLATHASRESAGQDTEIRRLLRTGKPIIPITDDLQAALTSTTYRQLGHLHFLQLTSSVWTKDLEAAVQRIVRGLGTARDATKLLLERSAGRIGRLVEMIEWIRSQPGEHVSLDRMPPTLYGEFEAAWRAIGVGERGELGPEFLGLLAVARAPVSLIVLQQFLELGDVAAQQLMARLFERNLVAVNAPDAEQSQVPPHLALSHESIRHEVLNRFSQGDLRRFHQALARIGSEDVDYALRYRLAHLIGAGQVEEAINTAGDVELLTRICTELGVDNLVAQLADVASAARRGDDDSHMNAQA